MPPDIRLIALDLDGTLLSPENRVSDEDAAAVREAVAAGAQVVLATARWHAAAGRTAALLGLDGFIISHNGALVRSRDDGEELFHHRIEQALASEIAEFLDAASGDAYVTVNDSTYVRSQRLGNPRMPAGIELTASLRPHVTAPATAFLVFGRDAVRSTVERFSGYHGSALNLAEGFSDSFPGYLNIVHALADKGAALRAVCEHQSISPLQAMAIGDAAPDIPMLKSAGIGVAMGNAPEAVKAAADAIAPSNSESGVAWAIRRYVLGRP
ncbi:MAG TPA: Cof-type HAD-IIB family hydrolase [Dehalococcoidia bacterium]|nr:Cof-type HAD-IIB family hydrolase [Dehalococcoidia bacterium]